VQIIGTEFARAMMIAGKSQDSRAHEYYVGGVPAQIETLKKRFASTTDAAGAGDWKRSSPFSRITSGHQRREADAA
jgi:hypothetical protein